MFDTIAYSPLGNLRALKSGFWVGVQESRAEQALAALKRMSATQGEGIEKHIVQD
jgi:hypothetical protein